MRGNFVIRATVLTCACEVEVYVRCMIGECQYLVDEYGGCGGGGGDSGGAGGCGGGGDVGGFSLLVRRMGKFH